MTEEEAVAAEKKAKQANKSNAKAREKKAAEDQRKVMAVREREKGNKGGLGRYLLGGDRAE